jgi:hypothetical protein
MTRWIAFLAAAIGGILPGQLWAQFGKIPAAPAQIVAQLSEAIVSKGYRTVGVVPQFIVRTNGPDSVREALGPHSRLLADGVRDGLIASSQGNYQVADGQKMLAAFQGISADDLESPEKLHEIAKAAGGLGALVIGNVTDVPSETPGVTTDVKCEVVDLADNSRTPIPVLQLKMSLAGLAYRGESFELRRWDAGMLTQRDLAVRWADMFQPVDFNPFITRRPPGLNEWFTHPNLDDTCPFHVDVMVGGKARPQTLIGRKLYVPVNYGEKYAIRTYNHGAKEAFVAIFIDGLNILGKKPEHPGNCRYWHLDPDSKGEFGGWFSGEAGKYTEEEFRISRATDSEAGKQGYIKSLGQITAVFYTVGSPLPPPPKPAPVYHGETTGAMLGKIESMAPGAAEDIGTEAGTGREVRLEEQPHDQPGLILAAISLFYRTPSRIEELKQANHP